MCNFQFRFLLGYYRSFALPLPLLLLLLFISCSFTFLLAMSLSLSSTLPEVCNYFPTLFATSVKISTTFLSEVIFHVFFPISPFSALPFCAAVLTLNNNKGKVFIAVRKRRVAWTSEEEAAAKVAN